MSVIRYEPFRDPFERLISMAATRTRAPLAMAMDVYRSEDGSYHVEADLPGVDPDGIEVTVEHGTLTIQAERTPHYGESERVIIAEGPQGSFTRQLTKRSFCCARQQRAECNLPEGWTLLRDGPGPLRQSRRLWVIERPARRGSRREQAEENGDRSGSRVPAWPELPGPPLPLSARTIAAQGRPAPFRAAPEPGESPSPYADLGAIR